MCTYFFLELVDLDREPATLVDIDSSQTSDAAVELDGAHSEFAVVRRTV